ncbi:hypothetical protein [Amazonocrinis nigriterrae]|nr:hypothetical protein [Amazonocrinis nigriterrae]
MRSLLYFPTKIGAIALLLPRRCRSKTPTPIFYKYSVQYQSLR